MKRIVSLLLILCVVFMSAAVNPVLGEAHDDTEKETAEPLKAISSMNDVELLAFLEEYVENYQEEAEYQESKFKLLKSFVDLFDSPGETLLPVSYSLYFKWAKEIDQGIARYYGNQEYGSPRQVRYTPVQNDYYASPTLYGVTNCYGFATGVYRLYDEGTGDFYPPDPGYSAGLTFNINSVTVFTLACYAKMDLQNDLGMNCVQITTTCPSSSVLSSGKSVICIRKGIAGLSADYHVMKLDSVGWLHKPGFGAILKLLIAHSASVDWLIEYTTDGVTWELKQGSYSGSIYYLIYKGNHSYSLQYTGNNYHSGIFHYYEYANVCTDCGAVSGAHYEKVPCSGPPCPVILGGGSIAYR